jgi:hypothetical protein
MVLALTSISERRQSGFPSNSRLGISRSRRMQTFPLHLLSSNGASQGEALRVAPGSSQSGLPPRLHLSVDEASSRLSVVVPRYSTMAYMSVKNIHVVTEKKSSQYQFRNPTVLHRVIHRRIKRTEPATYSARHSVKASAMFVKCRR